MKLTINVSDFRDAFQNSGSQSQFSYEGQDILFDYFEQLEQETGAEIELDVISICCDYSEDTVEQIADSYDIDIDGMDEDDAQEAVLEYLNDNTSVVGYTNFGIIYQQF